MTAGEPPVTTRAELNAALIALLRSAHENRIDVEGAFECRNGSDHPDWDVIVTEVEKPDQSE